MISMTNVTGERLDARSWAGRLFDVDETVEFPGEVLPDQPYPDAVVILLDGDAQPRAVPRSTFRIAGHDKPPAAAVPTVADMPEDATPRDLVTALAGAGATFSPGAADESNPLGLTAPDQPPADPPADQTPAPQVPADTTNGS